MYRVVYHPKVVSTDIPRLGGEEKERVKNAIERKLMTKPSLYTESLRGSLRGYSKLRVGDHRIIVRIKEREQSVYILMIEHRSCVYTQIVKRI